MQQFSTTIRFKSIEFFKDQTLGIGSYGKVCKAKCDNLLCAAKIIHETLCNSKSQHLIANDKPSIDPIRKFEQEVEFLREIRHPNIVQYLGIHHDPDTGLPVLLMELMDESLTSFLKKSLKPVPYHIQVNICHDISLALSFLHSNKIIHRDLSGNNVLLFGNSRAKVTDFGMARLENCLTYTTCPGTDVYMPPEAVTANATYTEKIDCFSFGVVVIQILTKEFPAPQERFMSVNDSLYARPIQMTVPEIERRQNQLTKIDTNHPLQPLILNCLKDRDVERPSAHRICDSVAVLKEIPEYKESIEAANKEKEREIRSLKQQHVQQIQGLQNTIQLQVNRLEDKEKLIEQKEKNIAEKESYIMQKDKAIAAEKENTQQLRLELQRIMAQHEKEVKQLETRKDFVIEEQAKQIGQITEQLQENERARADLEKRCNELERKLQKLGGRSKNGIRFKWREGRSAPTAMYRFNDACTNGTMVYFRESKRIFAYDTTSHDWSQLPDCPYSDSSIVIIKTLLTTVGGFDHRLKITNKLFSLTGDGKGQNWNDVFPPMPTKREYAAALSTGSYLIVAGGEKAGEVVLQTVEVMNIETRRWSVVADLPEPLSQLSVTLCGDRIYLLGGKDGSRKPCQSVYACTLSALLHLLENRRSSLPNKSKPVWNRLTDLFVNNSTCVSFGGHVLAIGGEHCDSTGKPTTAVQIFDPVGNSWKVVGQMLTTRSKCFAAVLPDNQLMVVGGCSGAYRATDTVEFANEKQ